MAADLGPVAEEAARLWREHRDAAFPAGLRGAEFGGRDVVLLDADVAGCVLAWFDGGGALDPWRVRVLRGCVEGLDRVVPRIDDPAGSLYFERLRRLARLVSGTLPGAE